VISDLGKWKMKQELAVRFGVPSGTLVQLVTHHDLPQLWGHQSHGVIVPFSLTSSQFLGKCRHQGCILVGPEGGMGSSLPSPAEAVTLNLQGS
jgi:hypothetical protein